MIPHTTHTDRDSIQDWFRALQLDICEQLEAADGVGTFTEDAWERPGGGGDYARVLEGQRIEKGGVNFSAVHGTLPQNIRDALQVNAGDFLATGVSIVQHPHNPHVPIIHMNVRYFELSDGTYWFGGGIDLTPHYVRPADARWFHEQLKAVCDRYDEGYYPRFKQWADDYFYVRHRQETRGVGGIFFDRMHAEDKASIWQFVQEVGNAFGDIYTHFLATYSDLPYTATEQQWQRLRRGRYVEFNLVWDKGTKFGLDTDGRTESILMSLPPMASWVYDHRPVPGSAEADTLAWLRKGVDWVNLPTDATP